MYKLRNQQKKHILRNTLRVTGFFLSYSKKKQVLTVFFYKEMKCLIQISIVELLVLTYTQYQHATNH